MGLMWEICSSRIFNIHYSYMVLKEDKSLAEVQQELHSDGLLCIQSYARTATLGSLYKTTISS